MLKSKKLARTKSKTKVVKSKTIKLKGKITRTKKTVPAHVGLDYFVGNYSEESVY